MKNPPDFTEEHINALLDEIYKHGASPELVYLPLSNALLYGLIGKWEYRVRCVMQRLHIPQPAIRFRETNELQYFSEGWQRGYQAGLKAARGPLYPHQPHSFYTLGSIELDYRLNSPAATEAKPPTEGTSQDSPPRGTGD